MNKYFLFFIILFLPANAEIVTVTEKFSHTGDVSRIEACNIAEQRAITKAKRQVLGQKITSEEFEICSEVDGKTTCHRNQFSLIDTNGEVTEFERLDVNQEQKEIDGILVDICEVTIKANIQKRKEELDTSYDFNVKLNKLNFRENENLSINISINKPIYLTVFQYLPYETKDFQITKIFPNHLQPSNLIEEKQINIPSNGKFVVQFPKNVNKKIIDEHLIFLFSKNSINWLNKYTKKEDLIKKYMSEKQVKLIYKGYTIVK